MTKLSHYEKRHSAGRDGSPSRPIEGGTDADTRSPRRGGPYRSGDTSLERTLRPCLNDSIELTRAANSTNSTWLNLAICLLTFNQQMTRRASLPLSKERALNARLQTLTA
jgi:hypothetical protein